MKTRAMGRIVSGILLMGLLVLPGHSSKTPKTLPNEHEPSQFDYDGDGNIGSTDLLCFLEMWGLQNVEAPTPTPTEGPSNCVNPFQGTYQGNFSGPVSGSVTITIDAMGSATGTSIAGPDRSTFEGALSLDGDFNSLLRESGQIMGIAFGKFSGNSGNGQWRNFDGQSGTWNVTRSR